MNTASETGFVHPNLANFSLIKAKRRDRDLDRVFCLSLSSPGINFHQEVLKKTLHFWTFDSLSYFKFRQQMTRALYFELPYGAVAILNSDGRSSHTFYLELNESKVLVFSTLWIFERFLHPCLWVLWSGFEQHCSVITCCRFVWKQALKTKMTLVGRRSQKVNSWLPKWSQKMIRLFNGLFDELQSRSFVTSIDFFSTQISHFKL